MNHSARAWLNLGLICGLLARGAGAIAQPPPTSLPAPDRCIALITTNLAKGRENWYTYQTISEQRVKIRKGDTLSYRVFLDPRNPEPKGGVDVDFTDHASSLRELGLKDDQGVLVHGNGDLSAAKGKWLSRRIDLSSAAGREISIWHMVEEGDADGTYIQFVDDIVITHADGSTTVIYQDGPVPARGQGLNHGYTENPTCVAIESALLKDGASVEAVAKLAEELGKRSAALDSMRRQVDLARQFAQRDADVHLGEHAAEADQALRRAERAGATPEEIDAALNTARGALDHAHPAMEKFTGHLVGHAHIDLQWLWEWQEGICFTRDTFVQATKFMDEFKGFTFSQSSSCLYAAMEEHEPALFAKIQEKVKAGQWELIGGRVCEGDTNMISEESSARQFLYGQRYFREKFGAGATVGWEPDTFGHTIQMPQILKLSGCDFYYFCRGGKGKPLFWWEGLDGSRVLAFDEPATGSWYNADLSYKQFQEMLDFNTTTGSKDMLWVYGVGNHGGGPTREHLQWALAQMQSPGAPKIRFSTASEFFRKLSSYDLSRIPSVHDELNGVFEGCYTTHAEIKQLNRQAEAATTSAEAVAAIASLSGFRYPHAAFRRNWEDICFNHHHDTLPGTGIHAPYQRTKTMLARVLADDADITTRALESLAVRVKPTAGGVNVLVFNPTGAARSEWVETDLVRSGWDRADVPDPEHCVAIAPDGSQSPATLINPASRRIRFLAANVPGLGYRVFHLGRGEPRRAPIEIRDGGATIETDKLIVEFDAGKGVIKRLYDKAAKQERCAGALGRLEIHWEDGAHMDAWNLGPITKVEAPAPVSSVFRKGVDFGEAEFSHVIPAWNALSGESRVTQRFRISADSDAVTVDIDCQWNGVGTNQSPNALLRIACDVNASKPVATYHVPFGALSRPTDGREYPALQWVDVSGAVAGAGSGSPEGPGGLTLIQDSKHGFACKDRTLTMSLIRAPFYPDPVPNPGTHHWRYALISHAGDWRAADAARRAQAFNQPLLSTSVPYDSSGPAPLEWSLSNGADPAVTVTGLKLAESDEQFILRCYESRGTPAQVSPGTVWHARSTTPVNFIEDPIAGANGRANTPLTFRPFEIKSLHLSPDAAGLTGEKK